MTPEMIDRLVSVKASSSPSENDIKKMVKDVVDEVTLELDKYLVMIDQALLDKDNLTTPQVETMIMNLPTLIYFVVSEIEGVGIQEDYAKMRRGEVYAKALSLAEGKVDEKKAQAEAETAADTLIHSIYARAYKTIKSRVDAAYEVLNSLKKVYTMRITEAELSNNKFSGRRGE